MAAAKTQTQNVIMRLVYRILYCNATFMTRKATNVSFVVFPQKFSHSRECTTISVVTESPSSRMSTTKDRMLRAKNSY